jgi:hypothetical protein
MCFGEKLELIANKLYPLSVRAVDIHYKIFYLGLVVIVNHMDKVLQNGALAGARCPVK